MRLHGSACVDQVGVVNVTAAGVGWPGYIVEMNLMVNLCATDLYVLGEFIHLPCDCLLTLTC